MKCDFTTSETAEQATAPVIESPAPAPAPAPINAPVPYRNEAAVTAPAHPTVLLGDRLPEVEDIIFPRINIVQKVGELSNQQPQGAIMLARSLLLFELPIKDNKGSILTPGTPPVEIVVLGFKAKRWQEKIDWGSDDRALILDSEEAVIRNGGTTSYQEWELKKGEGMRLFVPMVDALLGIRKPDHVDDPEGVNFCYDVGGQKWALALWTLKGTSYTGAAKVWFTARATGCLRKGYPSFTWNLSTALKPFGKNFAYVPVLVPKGPSSPDLLEFVRRALTIE